MVVRFCLELADLRGNLRSCERISEQDELLRLMSVGVPKGGLRPGPPLGMAPKGC